MTKEKLGFTDFIDTVDIDCQPFVTELHNDLTANGCKIEVKAAKSGYVVSYILGKKTVANYVFRKKGLIMRIYANHIRAYMPFLDTLPDDMVKAIQAAPPCKRFINPNDCNSKCAMGYDFILRGEPYQKCRYNAFMFLITEETKPFIQAFLLHEVEASRQSS